jgi:hypothetical protein
MQLHTVRRWFAGAGVGIVGTLVAVVAVPAVAAQRADATIDMFLPPTTVSVGAATPVDAVLFASAPVALADTTVTFDLTGLAGVATATTGDGAGSCHTPDETTLVCTSSWPLHFDQDGMGGVFIADVRAVKGAEPGATGTLKATLTANGVPPVVAEAKIRVGEGVDVTAGDTVNTSAKPGGAFTAPLTVRNTGKNVVDGIAVLLYSDFAVAADKRFSNCTYVDDKVRSCYFDTKLEPGATYRVTLPYRLRADTLAPSSAVVQLQWQTLAEVEDVSSYLDKFGYSLGKPGDGDALPLSPVVVAAGVPQTDTKPNDNWTYIEVAVAGKQGADFSAIGDRVGGAAGAVVTATVGARNSGPASIDYSNGGDAVAWIDVAVPEGTTVVTVPDGCRTVSEGGEDDGDQDDGDQDDGGEDGEDTGKPGAKRYLCLSDVFFAARTSQTFDFGLRIDTVVPNATGKIVLKDEASGYPGYHDESPANNTASLVVNGTDDGGEGGGLPVTGPAGALMAGTGVLLLVGGGVGLVLARRRRMRFIA